MSTLNVEPDKNKTLYRMQMTDNPNENAPRLALAFSGGGFRAAAFCLGALTYLNRLKINGKSLLSHSIALSTVSGGTITGARYAIGICNNETPDEVYKSLYQFLSRTDIVKLTLDRLSSSEGWGPNRIKSLINSFADVYDCELFNHAKFGCLLQDPLPSHLKHTSFNATEFSSGVQFRFQWSEKIINPLREESERGIIGNKFFKIDSDAAGEIRMADILAASSCFPAGFEPINFPTDFQHIDSPNLDKLLNNRKYPIGLMDGGIVDNQGIEPILLAEQRLQRNRPTDGSNKGNEIDLIIVCDVASPFLDAYKATVENRKWGWRDLTPFKILIGNTILLTMSIVSVMYAVKNSITWLMLVGSSTTTISLIVYLIGSYVRNLPKKFEVPKSFLKPMGKLLKIKLRVYETMLSNRIDSVLKMTVGVFLKHIRNLNYDKVYDAPEWKNRSIMNAVYELKCFNRTLNDKIRSGKLPNQLVPSSKIQEMATAASSMGTTLWFTEQELKDKMLDDLIATGHFTTCWNLLEYIEKIKQDSSNTNERHKVILSLEKELVKDWENFNKEPGFLVNEMNARIIKLKYERKSIQPN